MAGVKRKNGNKTINEQENIEQYFKRIVDEHKNALNEDDESKLDEIDDKLSNLDLTFTQFIKLPANFTVVYFNHNEHICQYFPREKSTRTKLFKHLQSVVFNDVFDKEEMTNFLIWTGQLWTDNEFSELVKRLCDSLTINNKSLLIRLRNLVVDFVHFEKTMEIIKETSKRLKIKYVDEEMSKRYDRKAVIDELFGEEVNNI